MSAIEQDIAKQADFVGAIRYQREQIQNEYYEAKLKLQNITERLEVELHHLQDLKTQLNKGKQ